MFSTGSFFAMRYKKLQELYQFVKSHCRVAILKGPSGSGKSFFANLFYFYLLKVKKLKKSQVFYMQARKEYSNYEKFFDYFNNETKLNFSSLHSMREDEYFFIIDEMHLLYSQEKFEILWNHVKHCSETNLSIDFVFCAVYSNRLAASSDNSSFVLADKYLSFDFLCFDEAEFTELLDNYHKHDKDSGHCEISAGKKKILYEIFQGHPEFSFKAI